MTSTISRSSRCRSEPGSYWDAGTPYAGECTERDAAAPAALERAEVLAAARIGELFAMDFEAAN